MNRWAFILVSGGILAVDVESMSFVLAILKNRLVFRFLIGSRLALLVTLCPKMPSTEVKRASYRVLRFPTNCVVHLVSCDCRSDFSD